MISQKERSARDDSVHVGGSSDDGFAQRMASQWTECEEKMISEGCNGAAIAAFKASYEKLVSGQSPFIAESAIEAAGDDKVPTYESIAESTTVDNELLSKVVVVKLNGGLGTGMGLDKDRQDCIPKRTCTLLWRLADLAVPLSYLTDIIHLE